MKENNNRIISALGGLSSPLDLSTGSVAIVLAAGHGKRIRSERSKMLHTIWGVPTVNRVISAVEKGLENVCEIIVVGIKALQVARAVGKRDNRIFVYQREQNGTGDAVRTAIDAIPKDKLKGVIYIFPGDMGLLNDMTISKFSREFTDNPCDMMVLTGEFRGNPMQNYYGRIIRIPPRDRFGNDSGKDAGKVAEIKEFKDIVEMDEGTHYILKFNSREYLFSREELLNIREFNAGVYAFKAHCLSKYLKELRTDNVQGELYVTDMISIFKKHGLSVKASTAADNKVILGFNIKSVLKKMEAIAREEVYNKLKDIITIEDEEDFFIAEEVVEQILHMDKQMGPLDIRIGKGVYVSKGVQLNKGVIIKNFSRLDGNIILGENVCIEEGAHLSTYHDQTMKLGRGAEILKGNIIKGNLIIGENSRIESGVNITGSDEFPTRIGNNVLIKGTSYIFGSIIEDDLWIEHSVLKCKYVERVKKKNGKVQKVRYILPLPEGLDSIRDIEGDKGEI
ncbi:MAG: NTP transferase domain-containing protein [Fidelibacterota bacterium]